MARPLKIGLDYFPLDVDFFDDEKIQFISARFGIKGEIITVKLLSRIYRNSFYIKFTDDDALLFAKRAGDGITPALVNEVVSELVKRDFFNDVAFNSFQVLTSKGIQKRYFHIVGRRKEINYPAEYLLIDNINECNNEINVYNNSINDDSKCIKESKVKEIKENETNIIGRKMPPDEDEVIEYFQKGGYDTNEAQKFYSYYSAQDWCTNSNVYIGGNWKHKANYWVRNKIKNDIGNNSNGTSRKIHNNDSRPGSFQKQARGSVEPKQLAESYIQLYGE